MQIAASPLTEKLPSQLSTSITFRQRIAATIRSALLSIEKGPLPTCSRKEAKLEITKLNEALEILLRR